MRGCQIGCALLQHEAGTFCFDTSMLWIASSAIGVYNSECYSI